MPIHLTVSTGGWTYGLFEDNEKTPVGRISIEYHGIEHAGIEREHRLYEAVKNLMQCINELDQASDNHLEAVAALVEVTDDSD